MSPRCALIFTLSLLAATLLASCDRSAVLKGQTNLAMPFYGMAVDQDGQPLPGASFQFRVEAYPRNWTFETRGRDNDVSWATATSNAQGRFQFEVDACQVIRMKAERGGYRHLCEKQVGRSLPGDNFFYCLIAWSAPWYKSDPDHPAVFVFVKDGTKEVSALPCKGGYDSGGGKQWRLNKPGWPREPSLKDVVYKKPTTAP